MQENNTQTDKGDTLSVLIPTLNILTDSLRLTAYSETGTMHKQDKFSSHTKLHSLKLQPTHKQYVRFSVLKSSNYLYLQFLMYISYTLIKKPLI